MRRAAAGFTLVELILVMVLLATILALSAPLLSRSNRQRAADHEATRFLALIEYARDEARSQGVPMSVWVDPEKSQYGVEPKTGFAATEGRDRTFTMNKDLQLELTNVAPGEGGRVIAAEMNPDGTMELTSADTFRFFDQNGSQAAFKRTEDNWTYEVNKEAAPAK